MNKPQMVATAVIASFFTLITVVGVMTFFGRAMAAPRQQTAAESFQYMSISGLAFEPVEQNAAYAKDLSQHLLRLTSQPQTAGPGTFIAPLTLPDKGELLGLTLFGVDSDNQGQVRVLLQRCDHSQARCVPLAEAASGTVFAAGQFETLKANIANQVVDNRFYTYLLELELSAGANSGLRSVRLELLAPTAAAAAQEGTWALEGNVTRFTLPNTGFTQARICTDDLSHLDNPTHYPFVQADDSTTQLSSNACVTVWGRDIEIRREFNTGPSSGTFELLR